MWIGIYFLNHIYGFWPETLKSCHSVFSFNGWRFEIHCCILTCIYKWINDANNAQSKPWTYEVSPNDQRRIHKTIVMSRVKCLLWLVSSHMTWVRELMFDRVRWTHSLLSTYILALVSFTPMTRTNHYLKREGIVCTDLHGLSMSRWQYYDQERFEYVYKRERSYESHFFRLHSHYYISFGLIA